MQSGGREIQRVGKVKSERDFFNGQRAVHLSSDNKRIGFASICYLTVLAGDIIGRRLGSLTLFVKEQSGIVFDKAGF